MRGTVPMLLLVFLSACSVPMKAPESPSACVRAMSSSARSGDVRAYLDCFGGELRATLEDAARTAETEAFAENIRARMEPVRGMALSEETLADENTATLRVEWVFDDRNEVQIFTLLREKGVWRIVEMKEAQYTQPEIPYGTEVF